MRTSATATILILSASFFPSWRLLNSLRAHQDQLKPKRLPKPLLSNRTAHHSSPTKSENRIVRARKTPVLNTIGQPSGAMRIAWAWAGCARNTWVA